MLGGTESSSFSGPKLGGFDREILSLAVKKFWAEPPATGFPDQILPFSRGRYDPTNEGRWNWQLAIQDYVLNARNQ
jgi:hypothetical protein